MTLHLEGVGWPCPRKKYRVSDGEIQVRQLKSGKDSGDWRTLSPAELTTQVEKKTILAQWLRQRLGWRVLLRSCVADQEYLYGEAATESGHHSA